MFQRSHARVETQPTTHRHHLFVTHTLFQRFTNIRDIYLLLQNLHQHLPRPINQNTIISIIYGRFCLRNKRCNTLVGIIIRPQRERPRFCMTNSTSLYLHYRRNQCRESCLPLTIMITKTLLNLREVTMKWKCLTRTSMLFMSAEAVQ